jgi:sarcosine oxidase/L-pipecolate oxidase
MMELAVQAMGLWDELERDAGDSMRWMSGLLNFGDPEFGEDTPEVEFLWTA